MSAAGKPEWLLQVATSLVFLVPGYLVVRFLQTTRETREADKFELSIQSLIFSLLIGAIWFYLSPPGARLRHLLGRPDQIIPHLLAPWPIVRSLVWLAGITLVIALGAGYFRKYQLYWWLLEKIGFARLNSFITTWEELSDLAQNGWVSVEMKGGQTYTGVIRSVTHHPFERALILSRSAKTPMQLSVSGKGQEDCEVEHVWIPGDEIESIGVFPRKSGKAEVGADKSAATSPEASASRKIVAP